MAGLTSARKAVSKWARTKASGIGSWAVAAMSHRACVPAGVSGSVTAGAVTAEDGGAEPLLERRQQRYRHRARGRDDDRRANWHLPSMA